MQPEYWGNEIKLSLNISLSPKHCLNQMGRQTECLQQAWESPFSGLASHLSSHAVRFNFYNSFCSWEPLSPLRFSALSLHGMFLSWAISCEVAPKEQSTEFPKLQINANRKNIKKCSVMGKYIFYILAQLHVKVFNQDTFVSHQIAIRQCREALVQSSATFQPQGTELTTCSEWNYSIVRKMRSNRCCHHHSRAHSCYSILACLQMQSLAFCSLTITELLYLIAARQDLQ